MEEHMPRRKLSDLEVGKNYMVTRIREVTTRFGRKVVADFNEEFQLFLPSKISAAILKDEEFFIKLSDDANRLNLSVMYQGGNSFKFESCK